MANTTYFGWETPDDTDLVKDGAAAIRTLGQAIDTSLQDLEGGTTGQVLSKTSNTDMDFTWVTTDDANAIQNAIVDAKGDIIAASANDTPARLAVGTNDQRLVAASGEATGLKYVSDTQNTVIDAEGDLLYGTAADTIGRLAIGTAGQVLKVNSGATAPEWGAAGGSGFVGVKAIKNATQSIANNTETAITFAGTDTFDTDAFHDPSSNNTRFTIPAGKGGYYLVSGNVGFASNSVGNRESYFNLNGSFGFQAVSSAAAPTTATVNSFSFIANLSVDDYIELYVNQTSGGSLNANTSCIVSMQFLGA